MVNSLNRQSKRPNPNTSSPSSPKEHAKPHRIIPKSKLLNKMAGALKQRNKLEASNVLIETISKVFPHKEREVFIRLLITHGGRTKALRLIESLRHELTKEDDPFGEQVTPKT